VSLSLALGLLIEDQRLDEGRYLSISTLILATFRGFIAEELNYLLGQHKIGFRTDDVLLSFYKWPRCRLLCMSQTVAARAIKPVPIQYASLANIG
jgi:hypothetical protein